VGFEAYEGQHLACEVTASNLAGHASERGLGKVVVGIPHNESLPRIVGHVTVGSTVECEPGGWEGAEPISFATKWFRDGLLVAGRDGPSYALGPPDREHELTCQVTHQTAWAPEPRSARA
jgi:hypothetical protein